MSGSEALHCGSRSPRVRDGDAQGGAGSWEDPGEIEPFVEARLENVGAAIARGTTGVHYREPSGLRKALGFVSGAEGDEAAIRTTRNG
ncbi:hypothetical protein ACFXAE_25015 [Streptomyces sp. NPDC059454]|uniref:hypothetical protein n=1 Tax=Streptomyces sp. NPDC059454 TaxID=3346836 RepID=UPI003692839D